MATGLQVYVVTHRPFPEVALPYAQTLWVGDAGEGRTDSDRTGDSIWQKNPTHCELTALYWIWKNALSLGHDHVGLFHYRRFLGLNSKVAGHPLLADKPAVLVPVSEVRRQELFFLQSEDLASLAETDVVLPIATPLSMTIRDHFVEAHGETGWQVMTDALRETWPDWVNDLWRFEETACRLGNLLVARTSVFSSFCEWLFPIISSMEEKVAEMPGFDTIRFFGYPAERLTHLYFERLKEEGLAVKEVPTFIMDDANEEVWSRLEQKGDGEVWLWGAGSLGRRFFRGARLRDNATAIGGFVDLNSKMKGMSIEGLPVHPPTELFARKQAGDAPFVIVASTAWPQIERELVATGFVEGPEYAILRGLT